MSADVSADSPEPVSGIQEDRATEPLNRWICESCGMIYDPAEGDPDGGIVPGTAFEDIPNDWFCPVCGARKRDFAPYDG
jgi:rubredoxin